MIKKDVGQGFFSILYTNKLAKRLSDVVKAIHSETLGDKNWI